MPFGCYVRRPVKPSGAQITGAVLFTGTVLALGYTLLGLLPAMLFALGFVGGLLLWLFLPGAAPLAAIKVPYFLTLAFFILHKAAERQFDFFPTLSRITGKPMPEPGGFLPILLYAFAGAWLLIPLLVSRKSPYGYYLAWTFFTSMGVIELAHFIFPLFTPEPYGYFPGMVTVVPLAPVAWLGMWRLLSQRSDAAAS